MKLVFWLLVAVAFFYGFYAAAMATWSYMQVSSVVDQAMDTRRLPERSERVRSVRSNILHLIKESGVRVGEEDVEVSEEDSTMQIRIRWTYPVIVYNDEVVFAIPLSVERAVRR